MWKGILGVIIVIAIICGLVDRCTSSCQSNNLKPIKYIEAVDNADFEKAHDILNQHYAKYLDAYRSNPRKMSYSTKSYWQAAHHIYKAEMQYLLPLNDPEANNRLIYTLQSMNEIGRKPTSDKSYGYDEYPEVDAYANNRLCDDMLDIAITYNNRNMAKRLLALYKDDVEKLNDKLHIYTVSTTSREKARERYNEAGY